MSTPLPPPTPTDYKDRRAACIVFGIAEIVMGVLCVLMVLLMLLATSVATPAVDPRGLLVSLSFYGLVAVALVWLGIGSALCRRWARTLLLILAWSWLVAGATAIIMLAVILPQMLGQLVPGTPGLVVALVLLCLVGVFFVILPGVMIVFYRSKHTVATFEARDPHPRWTDACPLPVLTTSLWFAVGAVMLALMPMGYGAIFPCFGRLVSGPPAVVLQLLVAGLWLWFAWGFYRLRLSVLWASLAVCSIWFVSGTITFARVDFLEVYRVMGYPQEQIDMIRQMGLFGGQTMAWMMALLGIATVAFLIWLKKYFPPTESSATT